MDVEELRVKREAEYIEALNILPGPLGCSFVASMCKHALYNERIKEINDKYENLGLESNSDSDEV